MRQAISGSGSDHLTDTHVFGLFSFAPRHFCVQPITHLCISLWISHQLLNTVKISQHFATCSNCYHMVIICCFHDANIPLHSRCAQLNWAFFWLEYIEIIFRKYLIFATSRFSDQPCLISSKCPLQKLQIADIFFSMQTMHMIYHQNTEIVALSEIYIYMFDCSHDVVAA